MTTTCRHGVQADLCAICRNPGDVFISAGGSVYHRTNSCPALASGQARVDRRGGTLAEIVRVALASQDAANRSPCAVCKPSRRT